MNSLKEKQDFSQEHFSEIISVKISSTSPEGRKISSTHFLNPGDVMDLLFTDAENKVKCYDFIATKKGIALQRRELNM